MQEEWEQRKQESGTKKDTAEVDALCAISADGMTFKHPSQLFYILFLIRHKKTGELARVANI